MFAQAFKLSALRGRFGCGATVTAEMRGVASSHPAAGPETPGAKVRGDTMKRINIVGLCLVTAIALTALTAASASAAEYGQCRLLTKNTTPKIKHGKYTDTNCQVLNLKTKGDYEWYPGPPANCIALKKGEYTDSACATKSAKPHRGAFERQSCYPNCATYTSSSGSSVGLASLGEMECTGGSGTGEITGAKTDTDQERFTGCTAARRASNCSSYNVVSKTGEVVSARLETVLIGHFERGPLGHEPVTGEAWTEFTNQHGSDAPYSYEFECTGLAYVRAKGSVSGVMSEDVNKMSLTSATRLETGLGEQGLECEAAENQSFSPVEAYFACSQEADLALTFAAAVEIRTG
jgi:hypothetical protein